MAGRCGEGIAFEFVLPPQGDRIGLDLMEAPAPLARFLNRHAPVPVEFNRAVRMADSVVVIVASASGLDPLRCVIGPLLVTCMAAIFVVITLALTQAYSRVCPAVPGSTLLPSRRRAPRLKLGTHTSHRPTITCCWDRPVSG